MEAAISGDDAKLKVSFAEYRLFYRALLQMRPIVARAPDTIKVAISGDDATKVDNATPVVSGANSVALP